MVGCPEHRQSCPTDLHQFWTFRDEIAVHDGILMKGNCAIIPKACQPEILCQIHTGRQGIEKCRLRARQAVTGAELIKSSRIWYKGASSASTTKSLTPKRPSFNKQHFDLQKFCQQTFYFGAFQIIYYWSIITLRT